VAGTEIINCGESVKRNYQYKLYKVVNGSPVQIGNTTDLNNSTVETSLDLTNTSNQTTESYKVELYLQNNNE
jgi:hypothetical protein